MVSPHYLTTWPIRMTTWRPFTAWKQAVNRLHSFDMFWSWGTDGASCLYIGPATYNQPLCFLRGGGRWQTATGTMLALCCASANRSSVMDQCNSLISDLNFCWLHRTVIVMRYTAPLVVTNHQSVINIGQNRLSFSDTVHAFRAWSTIPVYINGTI